MMPDEGTEDVPKHVGDLPVSDVYILVHIISVRIASVLDVAFCS
jgi:hypothetical protein